MATTAYGKITIIDVTDIENIYMVYAGSSSNSVAPDSTNFNLWKTDITQVTGDYIWQRTVVKKSGVVITSTNFQDYYGDPVCISGPEGESGRHLASITTEYTQATAAATITTSNMNNYTWTTNVPPYNSNTPTYWVRVTSVYAGSADYTDTYNGEVLTGEQASSENTTSGDTNIIYQIYKDEGISGAIAAAQSASENAADALDAAESNINNITRLWYRTNTTTYPNAPSVHVTENRNNINNTWTTVRPIEAEGYYYFYYCDEICNGAGEYSWSNVEFDPSILAAHNAIVQAESNISSIVRLWYRSNSNVTPNAPSVHVTQSSNDVDNTWTTTKPIDKDGYYYYFYCDEICTGGGTYSWSNVVLESSKFAEQEINKLQSKIKYFWTNLINHTYGNNGWTKPDYPVGTYIASGNNLTFDPEDSSTYGYNTYYGNGIKLRYNSIELGTLSGTSLIFYKPSITTQGLKGMELKSDTLTFYNPGLDSDTNNKGLELNSGGLFLYRPMAYGETGSQTTAARLTTTGLNITQGSITLGTPENNIYPFQVTNDGYLRAQAGWIGGENSYVRLEESIGNEGEITHYLDVRLSQLDMLLDSDLYERNNIVNVLDIVAQQNDFIDLWGGQTVWLYYEDNIYYTYIEVLNPEGSPQEQSWYELINGTYVLSEDEVIVNNKTYYESTEVEPYIIYEYINNDTGTISYYYDENQFILNDYILTEDTSLNEDKEYFRQNAILIKDPSGNPKANNWYELVNGSYVYTNDKVVQYNETQDITYQPGKTYYYQVSDFYKKLEEDHFLTGVTYYEAKNYYELEFILINNPTGNPHSQNWYEPQVSHWVEHDIYYEAEVDENDDFTGTYYEVASQQYMLTNDIEINISKNYYIRSGEGTETSPYTYTLVSSPVAANLKLYYEQLNIYQLTTDSTPIVGKTYYKTLPAIHITGLGQSLKFERDSLGNQQKLIVSSARNDKEEKAKVEIDPWFINFSVKNEESSPLQWIIGYTEDAQNENDMGSSYMEITYGNKIIFSTNKDNDYFIDTKTGFKVEGLGLFHYKNGLAIGIV